MANNNQEQDFFVSEAGIDPIPLDKRTSWVSPAIVWAGCEFAISVIMTGTGIISNFTLKEFFDLIIWTSNLNLAWRWYQQFLGALTGRSSSVIARAPFGDVQSRILISFFAIFNLVGWWAIQTAITGNAQCTMFGINYVENHMAWVIVTVIAGILFAIPPIIGYSSMAWTDYIAVPGGLLLTVAAFYLSIKGVGFDYIWSYTPERNMLFTNAVSLVVGANVAQFVLMADYTRFCKPKFKDAFLVPLGVVATGFVLFTMGAVMGIGSGTADFDVVAAMKELGFGWWGFLVLWLAQWTSQLVNVYSLGLSLCNMFDMNTERQRKLLTIVGSIVGLVLALGGILNQFQNFLFFIALAFPAIGSIMAVDYFILHDRKWEDKKGWNIVATIALAVGLFIGYYTQYMRPWGIPAIQSYIISGGLYYVLTYVKAKIAPDQFTPEQWKGLNKNSYI